MCQSKRRSREFAPMSIIGRNTAKRFASRAAMSVASCLADVIHRLVNSLLDSYRPELYYMRGRGPKWRAKHHQRSRLDAGVVLQPPSQPHPLSKAYVRHREAIN